MVENVELGLSDSHYKIHRVRKSDLKSLGHLCSINIPSDFMIEEAYFVKTG